jgi:hypothetical protein
MHRDKCYTKLNVSTSTMEIPVHFPDSAVCKVPNYTSLAWCRILPHCDYHLKCTTRFRLCTCLKSRNSSSKWMVLAVGPCDIYFANLYKCLSI